MELNRGPCFAKSLAFGAKIYGRRDLQCCSWERTSLALGSPIAQHDHHNWPLKSSKTSWLKLGCDYSEIWRRKLERREKEIMAVRMSRFWCKLLLLPALPTCYSCNIQQKRIYDVRDARDLPSLSTPKSRNPQERSQLHVSTNPIQMIMPSRLRRCQRSSGFVTTLLRHLKRREGTSKPAMT